MADQGSEGVLSGYLRRKRFEMVKPFLTKKILDIGCGSGMLAGLISCENYLGLEVDDEVLDCAKNNFPNHNFVSTLDNCDEKFDTIVMLAVIEHVNKPENFLKDISNYLNASNPEARIVLTTPHPYSEWIHDLGSSIGLFSAHANEEHETLLNRKALEKIGTMSNLKLTTYKRFLFGVNQMAIFSL